jgi:hypothetical protein
VSIRPSTTAAGGRLAAGAAGLLLLVATLLATAGPVSAAPAPGGARAAAPTTCPTDYNRGTTPGCIILRISVSAHIVNPTLVQVDWQVCIIPPIGVPNAGAGEVFQFELDGVIILGQGTSGPILPNGSGCTTDPEFTRCIPSGDHTGQATNADLGATNVADFTVGPGVVCAAATGSGGAGAGSGAGSATGTAAAAHGTSISSSGPLAFTGANIARMVLFALVLILLGAVITYVTRERRRTRTPKTPQSY